jgi:hypothetical protein
MPLPRTTFEGMGTEGGGTGVGIGGETETKIVIETEIATLIVF